MCIFCTCQRRPHDVPKNDPVQISNVERHIYVRLDLGWTSKLWTKFGCRTDVQHWSWTDVPNIDMISTSVQHPVFSGGGGGAAICCDQFGVI